MSEATSAADWSRPKGTLVELPSGNKAVLRDTFPVYLLLRTGQLPDEMFSAYQNVMEGDLSLLDAETAAELVDVMCCSMFLEPRVTRDGAEGTVNVADLDPADVDFVLARVSGGTPPAGFQDDSPSAEGGSDGEDVREPAKRAPRAAKRKPAGAQR